MTDLEHDALGRGRMTNTKRIELLERDRAQQSRVLSVLVDASKSFTPEQLAQLRAILTDVLGDAGLRVDAAEQQDEARRDFMFLRAFRRAVNGVAGKIGWLVIAAMVGGIIWLVNAGLNAWRG